MGTKADRQLGLFAAQSPSFIVSRVGKTRSKRKSAAGTQILGGNLTADEYNTDIKGPDWYGSPTKYGVARKMARDGHVTQSLAVKRAPLQAAMWDFEPASREPRDVEAADYANYVWLELNDFDRFLSSATLYMRDGCSLIEQVDDTRPIPQSRFPLHPGRGQGVVVTGLHRLPAWTVKYWHQSKRDPSQLHSVTQHVMGSDGETAGDRRIRADRLIRFTQNQEGANFAGVPYLRASYPPWRIKQTLMVLDAMAHERHGVGTPAMNLPENATEDDFDTAELILSELRAHEKGYLALPYGYEFKWENANVGTAIGEAIERCNRDIAFNVGAGFMLLGLTGKSGSYALAQSQQGQYEIQLEGDARFIANVLNSGTDGWSPVGRLIRLNYGDSVGLPRLVARNMPTRDWSRILPVLHNITTSKHITPDDRLEDFIRSALFLPKRDPMTARESGQGEPVKQEQNPPKGEPEESEESEESEEHTND